MINSLAKSTKNLLNGCLYVFRCWPQLINGLLTHFRFISVTILKIFIRENLVDFPLNSSPHIQPGYFSYKHWKSNNILEAMAEKYFYQNCLRIKFVSCVSFSMNENFQRNIRVFSSKTKGSESRQDAVMSLLTPLHLRPEHPHPIYGPISSTPNTTTILAYYRGTHCVGPPGKQRVETHNA